MEELECNLTLLGLTGVEDKLQDDVAATLEMLGNAGVRVWMLTGDKVSRICDQKSIRRMPARRVAVFLISDTTDIPNGDMTYSVFNRTACFVHRWKLQPTSPLALSSSHGMRRFSTFRQRHESRPRNNSAVSRSDQGRVW